MDRGTGKKLLVSHQSADSFSHREKMCKVINKAEVIEILNQGRAGLHSTIDDPKELAQKIVAILDDPEKAKGMGQNGRQYFLERFERKKVTREWKKLLKQL